jgi:hypothetical protein
MKKARYANWHSGLCLSELDWYVSWMQWAGWHRWNNLVGNVLVLPMQPSFRIGFMETEIAKAFKVTPGRRLQMMGMRQLFPDRMENAFQVFFSYIIRRLSPVGYVHVKQTNASTRTIVVDIKDHRVSILL